MNILTCHLVQSHPLSHKNQPNILHHTVKCPKAPKYFLLIKETTQVLTCNKGILKKYFLYLCKFYQSTEEDWYIEV